jgi:hypothetical protein
MGFELYAAAFTMHVDRAGAQTVDALAQRDIPAIVLKGPAIATWLYREREAPRTYGDIDLIVPPHRWEDAHACLRELGFVPELTDLAHPRMESEASYAYRRSDEVIDLHTTFFGLGAPTERVWKVLRAHTTPLRLSNRDVLMLAEGPRAMHIALHAAQHGRAADRLMEDLRRALDQVPESVWQEAARIAGLLDARPAFATGLRLLPEGEALAERLGVAGEHSARASLRIDGVPLSEGFEELRQTRGLRAKVGLVVSELFPRPSFMQWWTPLARRGRRGLVASYPYRLAYLAMRAPQGYLAWRRAQGGDAATSDASPSRRSKPRR